MRRWRGFAGMLLGMATGMCLSCGKMPMNGLLDGRWQLMQVERHADGGVEHPAWTYYDVSLELIELKRGSEEGAVPLMGMHARFQRTADSLHVRMIGARAKDMLPFGMNDTIQHFGIEQLDDTSMKLNSAYARLTFRKF